MRRCRSGSDPLTKRVRAPSWAVQVSRYWARAAEGLGAAKHCSTPEHQYTWDILAVLLTSGKSKHSNYHRDSSCSMPGPGCNRKATQKKGRHVVWPMFRYT